MDTSNTNWKVTFFVNETDRGGFFDSGNTLLNTINAVGFSNFGSRTAGTMNNFLLTSSPEPSAALSGGLDALSLLRHRRI